MRAAIAAHDAGAERRRRLEAPPDPQPLRRGRGRDQRGARQQRRGQPGDPRLRHGQGVGLPRRPGRDRDLHARGARRHLPARALGRGLLAQRGRQARAAAVRRRRLAAHGLRRRHHRPRAHPRALRAAHEAHGRGDDGLRGVLRLEAGRARGPLPGRHLLGPRRRRPQDVRREDGRARDRRRRPHLPDHDERLRVHGRRHGHGPARGAAAEGHGVHAVPPDDALPERDPAHRGLPRRGRLPHQLGGRPLHGEVRAERDGARVARRRVALGDDRDRRGPRRQRLGPARHAPPGRREDHRPAPGLARAVDDVRGRRPDPRAGAGQAGRALPHGRRRDGRVWRDGAHRAVRRRRVRVRLGARRQPARRQLADGDDHVRPPRRPGGRRVGALAHDGRRARVGSARRRAGAAGAARPQRGRAARGRSATTSAPRCSRTSASSAARTRW